MRILLTGGTGLIGQALCQHWQRQGHELWVWSRDPHKVQRLCSGARSVQRLEELSAAQPFDAVVNLAGAPIADRPWSAARRELLWRSRVELTRQLVDWMGQQPTAPRVLLSASAIGWYGDQGDTPLTEASPPGGKDFGSTLCMAWEQEAERASTHGVRVVRLRIAPVLAPKGGMLARLVPPFKLGLGGRLGHYPRQLSGGEQQRVALARAFVTRPSLLFADEPTGNLDTNTGQAIIELLFALNQEAGTTLVLVTHDEHLAERCGRILRLDSGVLVGEGAVA